MTWAYYFLQPKVESCLLMADSGLLTASLHPSSQDPQLPCSPALFPIHLAIPLRRTEIPQISTNLWGFLKIQASEPHQYLLLH